MVPHYIEGCIRVGSRIRGNTFFAVDEQDDRLLVVKFERRDPYRYLYLKHEAQLYAWLDSIQGTYVPQIVRYGHKDQYFYLIMSRGYCSLKDVMLYHAERDQTTPVDLVMVVAHAMIRSLRHVHENTVMHRCISASNILLNVVGSRERLGDVEWPYSIKTELIGYSTAKRYYSRTHGHLMFRSNKAFCGHIYYGSVNSHFGCELSRRDDLESLGYVIIHMAQGKLPWQHLDRDQKDEIATLKVLTSVEDMCDGLPPPFQRYFEIIRELRYTDEPNYDMLEDLFLDYLQTHSPDLDAHDALSRMIRTYQITDDEFD